MRRGQGAGLASGLASLYVFTCFYAARADLAKQRRQLAEMPQWQLRDIGVDPIAAKTAAKKSSWVAEPPWKKTQWQKTQWKKPKRNKLVWRSFARHEH